MESGRLRENPGNHRLLKQTSTLGKMIETIMKCNISRHVGKYDIVRNINLSFEGVNNHIDKGDPGDTWVSRRPLTRLLIKDF